MVQIFGERIVVVTGSGLAGFSESAAVVGDHPVSGAEQHGNLQLVAADLSGCRVRETLGDGFVHGANNQLCAEFVCAPVAKLDQLGKLMAGLDIQKRHRYVGRPERLFREAQQADGVFAAGKEQDGAFKLGGDFTHDVNRLRL